jgi:hypothetical protein
MLLTVYHKLDSVLLYAMISALGWGEVQMVHISVNTLEPETHLNNWDTLKLQFSSVRKPTTL